MDFKSPQALGQTIFYQWKDMQEWPLGGSLEDRRELFSILADRVCCSLSEQDVLAWGPDPIGKYTVSLRVSCFGQTVLRQG